MEGGEGAAQSNNSGEPGKQINAQNCDTYGVCERECVGNKHMRDLERRSFPHKIGRFICTFLPTCVHVAVCIEAAASKVISKRPTHVTSIKTPAAQRPPLLLCIQTAGWLPLERELCERGQNMVSRREEGLSPGKSSTAQFPASLFPLPFGWAYGHLFSALSFTRREESG